MMTLTLSAKQLLALVDRFRLDFGSMHALTDHEKLVEAELLEVYKKLHNKSLFPLKKNQFKLSIAQCIAMKLFYQNKDIHGPGLGDNLLRKITNSIDQKVA